MDGPLSIDFSSLDDVAAFTGAAVETAALDKSGVEQDVMKITKGGDPNVLGGGAQVYVAYDGTDLIGDATTVTMEVYPTRPRP